MLHHNYNWPYVTVILNVQARVRQFCNLAPYTAYFELFITSALKFLTPLIFLIAINSLTSKRVGLRVNFTAVLHFVQKKRDKMFL